MIPLLFMLVTVAGCCLWMAQVAIWLWTSHWPDWDLAEGIRWMGSEPKLPIGNGRMLTEFILDLPLALVMAFGGWAGVTVSLWIWEKLDRPPRKSKKQLELEEDYRKLR